MLKDLESSHWYVRKLVKKMHGQKMWKLSILNMFLQTLGNHKTSQTTLVYLQVFISKMLFLMFFFQINDSFLLLHLKTYVFKVVRAKYSQYIIDFQLDICLLIENITMNNNQKTCKLIVIYHPRLEEIYFNKNTNITQLCFGGWL